MPRVTKEQEKEYWELFNSLTNQRYNYQHTWLETELLFSNRHDVRRFSSYNNFKKAKSIYQKKKGGNRQSHIISLE